MSDYDYDEDEIYDNPDEDMYGDNMEVKQIIPPNDFKKQLVACTQCFFILTKNQWNDYSTCPNCDIDISTYKPTAKFTGYFYLICSQNIKLNITCITDPSNSWQKSRMKVVKNIVVKVPGAYAINLNEEQSDPYRE